MRQKPVDYIDNRSFFNALVVYKKECIDQMEKLSKIDADSARDYEYMLHCKKFSDDARVIADASHDKFANIVEKFSDELSDIEAYKIAHLSNDAYNEATKNAKLYSSAYAAFAGSVTARPMTKTYNYIGTCLYQIATRLMNRPNFFGYSWKSDMSADAVADSITRLNNFDVTKSENPFAYFSQVSWNAAIRLIKRENLQKEIKINILKNASIMEEFSEGFDDDGENSGIRENIQSMLSCLEPEEKKPMEKKHKKINKNQQRKLKEIDEKVAIAEKELEDQPFSKFDDFYDSDEEELDESME